MIIIVYNVIHFQWSLVYRCGSREELMLPVDAKFKMTCHISRVVENVLQILSHFNL